MKGEAFQVKFDSFRLLSTLSIWINQKSDLLAFKNKCNIFTTKRGIYIRCLQFPFSHPQTSHYGFSAHLSMETVTVNVTNDLHVAKSKALFFPKLTFFPDLCAAFDQSHHSLFLETPYPASGRILHILLHTRMPLTLLVPPFLYDLLRLECLKLSPWKLVASF